MIGLRTEEVVVVGRSFMGFREGVCTSTNNKANALKAVPVELGGNYEQNDMLLSPYHSGVVKI